MGIRTPNLVSFWTRMRMVLRVKNRIFVPPRPIIISILYNQLVDIIRWLQFWNREPGGGGRGWRGRRRSSVGPRTICNRELEEVDGARTMWKGGAVMWFGWPEMQRPARQRRTPSGDLFCLRRRPENQKKTGSNSFFFFFPQWFCNNSMRLDAQ